jgi:hypothetical protein
MYGTRSIKKHEIRRDNLWREEPADGGRETREGEVKMIDILCIYI